MNYINSAAAHYESESLNGLVVGVKEAHINYRIVLMTLKDYLTIYSERAATPE